MKKTIITFLIALPLFAAILIGLYFLVTNYYVFLCETNDQFRISLGHTCVGNPIGIKLFFGAIYIAGTVILVSISGWLVFVVSALLGEEVIDKTEDVILTIKEKAKSKKSDDKKGALSLIESIKGALSKK